MNKKWHYKESDDAGEIEAFVNGFGPRPGGIHLIVTGDGIFHVWVRDDTGRERYEFANMEYSGASTLGAIGDLLAGGRGVPGALGPDGKIWYFRKL